MSTRTRARVLAIVIVLIVVALTLAAFIAPAGAAKPTRVGQAIGGGGPEIPEEITLPVGGQFDGLFPLFITNPNRTVLAAQIVDKAPSGITIAPEVRAVYVSPGETARVSYSLRIDVTMPAGRYPIEIAAVPGPLDSRDNEVRFVNAIVQRYAIVVSGEAGDLRAEAIDSIDRQPASGVFIASRLGGAVPVPVARVEGPLFAARLVPGDYEVAFEAGGRPIASKQAKVTRDETTNLELEVSLLQFTDVTATEIDANGKLGAVAVNAQFDNALRPVTNAAFTLEVTLNGRTLDTVEVQRFETLAKGMGSVSTRYVPAGGWRNGKYEFRIRLAAENFTLVASQRPTVTVGPPATKTRWWLWAAGAALLALGLLGLLLWLVRRHRRSDDANPPPSQRRATKSLQATGSTPMK